MPVPKSPTSQGPRRLLRDVVYEQMLEAIENGTLVAGERLNDEELTSWLGVSRTPVREAIARLESEGLVEMAANRYTRVAGLSGPAHDQAAMLLAALHAWAIEHASEATAEARKAGSAAASKVTAGVDAHDVDAYRGLQDAVAALIGGFNNPLFTATEAAVRGRVKFHAPAADATIDWNAAAATARALATT
ncbi:GntR family transcriptional regulator [Curtobacterium flaccumfaciens]|uniref:GntR family transcriptional regulator n=1 Tax=Curtobacterium flaccumfaciens TaxID=2035 RepID=UPI001BDE4150|nr:GntR family transcriptional regulator [Curtobacterium flaccumfaciens]MBT1631540.1 GntR family transcriptional regulator [Curtobacterium flaccumfaciens pv. oortii]MCX2846849.1 GntR family transcriptional regulator [Curtobacterium flaccumfaciens pv. oortii]